ncbi:MAG: hypothetical protein QOJ70_863 [Acidobacteriota bacterium]|nr:hypothetical protein [Acidobacteriota bacterium]
MSIFEKLEKAIEKVIGGGRDRHREPLEISRAIINELESKITPLDGGRRVFPYTRVTVRLYAGDAERRAIYEVAFINERLLERSIREHLRAPKCETPVGLLINVLIEETSPPDLIAQGYALEYGSSAPQQDPAPVITSPLLMVVQGIAQTSEYRIAKRRTNIGRQAEVHDTEGRPFRRNDLAFLNDNNEVNQTVSKVQAHIEYNPQTGEYRLYDDESAFGTLIIREDGRRVDVTKHLGSALRPGDEIYFGQARVLFKNEKDEKGKDG